jgi:hypothetical protein
MPKLERVKGRTRVRFAAEDFLGTQHGFISWEAMLALLGEGGRILNSDERVTHLELTDAGFRFYVKTEEEISRQKK